MLKRTFRGECCIVLLPRDAGSVAEHQKARARNFGAGAREIALGSISNVPTAAWRNSRECGKTPGKMTGADTCVISLYLRPNSRLRIDGGFDLGRSRALSD
jgi:hypothetical protein